MSISRRPHREHTSRSRQSSTAAHVWALESSAGSGSTWWPQSRHHTINRAPR